MNDRPHTVVSYALVVVVSLLSAAFIFIAWFVFSGLNKGFELSDESYYCLATAHPFDSRPFSSCFGLVNYRFCFGNSDLYTLRVFKFVYQLLSLSAFAISVVCFLKKQFSSQKISRIFYYILFLVILISGFANYDYLPQTLSYNSWSLNFSLLFWACLLFNISFAGQKRIFLVNILSGFFIFLLFYAKPPNAILMGGAYLLVNAVFLRKEMLKNVLMLFIGMGVALFFLFGNPGFFYSSTSGILKDMSGSDHATMGLYVEQLKDYLANNFGYKRLFTEAVLLVAAILLRKWKKVQLLYVVCVVLWNAWYSKAFLQGNSVVITNDFNFILFFLINTCFVLSLLIDVRELKARGKLLLIILLLAGTPLALALGTNNPVFYTGSHALVYVVAALFMISVFIPVNVSLSYFPLYALFISFFIFSVLRQGMYTTPYRQTALKEKKLPLYFSKPLSNIYESEERFAFLYTLYCKMKKQDAARDEVTAGLSYVGGAYMAELPVFSLFSLPNPQYSMKSVEDILKNTSFEKHRLFMLIPQMHAQIPAFREVMKKNHLDLEKDYSLCDSLYAAYNNEYIYFYKARN